MSDFIRHIKAVCWTGINEHEFEDMFPNIVGLKFKISKKDQSLKISENGELVFKIPVDHYLSVSGISIEIVGKELFEKVHQGLPKTIYLSKGAEA